MKTFKQQEYMSSLLFHKMVRTKKPCMPLPTRNFVCVFWVSLYQVSEIKINTI